MEVRIDSVVVRKRIRSDLGDLESMMDSLRRHGQLTPILINRRSELIAGQRRLESARRLGWTSVQAVMVEQVNDQRMLELEIEENLQRRQLNEAELAAALQRLERLRQPGCLQRVLHRCGDLCRRLLPRRA